MRHPLRRRSDCRWRELLGTVCASLALFSLLAAKSQGLYMRPDLVDVPIDRLLRNLEAAVAANPDDGQALHHLARAHAMAYALALDAESTVQASRQAERLYPWFGFEPAYVPWARQASTLDPESRSAAARQHLLEAKSFYERALELLPDNDAIRLGWAWVEIELGERDEARDALRRIVETAAARERRSRTPGQLMAVEAIDYLLPLLDAEEDGEEIARLEDTRQTLEALPRPITPLAISLVPGLNPELLVDKERPVPFDLDGSGRLRAWPWLEPQAAWLVHDRHRTGHIRSALQLFGSRTFGLFFGDGFEALRLLDDNGDGALEGDELAGLAIWRDANRNGQSEAGEVLPLESWGVSAIHCQPFRHPSGLLYGPQGVELRQGQWLDLYDLIVEPVEPRERISPTKHELD